MRRPPAPVATPSSGHLPSANTHLGRIWLAVVRLIAVIGAAFGVGTFATRLSGHFADLQQICTGTVCAYGQLSPAAVRSFQHLGLSLSNYAIVRVSLTVTVALTWFAVAAVLAWRRSDDWLALLVAIWFVFAGAATLTGAYGLGATSTVQAPSAQAVNYGAEFGIVLLYLALFPTTRVPARAAYWLLVGFGFFIAGPERIGGSLTWLLRSVTLAGLALAQLYQVWLVSHPAHGQRVPRAAFATMAYIGFAGLAAVFLVAAPLGASSTSLIFYGTLTGLSVSQVRRYWRVATPAQRQQTKWAALGISIFVPLAALLLAPTLFNPSLAQSGAFYQTIHTVILIAASAQLPFAITLAISRYHLWDIDVLINKTLVYGSLTTLLVAIYAGLIIGMENLVVAVSGQESQSVVIVVATLTIAALFQPLRRRIQQSIDRRFYRRKYDAAKALAAFAITLRSEFDLSELGERLLAVVDETMQPASCSLWLRQPIQSMSDGQTGESV